MSVSFLGEDSTWVVSVAYQVRKQVKAFVEKCFFFLRLIRRKLNAVVLSEAMLLDTFVELCTKVIYELCYEPAEVGGQQAFIFFSNFVLSLIIYFILIKLIIELFLIQIVKQSLLKTLLTVEKQD